ncbi:MAG TPA: hypothetical protein VJ821_04930 [Anaerolineales bacterium]|nr:hypothetical protein [Anaerolineales bacterium]
MYLFSELQIIPLLLLFLLWGVGGWLMTLRWFDLEPHERGFLGFGIGLVVANWLGNFTARFAPMSIAFWISALLTLALGLISAWPWTRDLFPQRLQMRWSMWLAFIGAVMVFTWIGRGLGMLDDFQNLPLSSLMATGDIPPHFPGSPDTHFGYHYFLILLSVQFMRVASAAPWTALDLARGLTLALSMVLAGLLAWRLTRNQAIAWISAIFFAFAGGTRWLLLLLPGTILNRISDGLTLIGSGRATADNLVEALSRFWVVEGSGPIGFPFAFVNGVNAPALLTHNGYGLLPAVIMLLLLLLGARVRTWQAGIPLTILLASLALANEVDFVILYLGVVLVAILWGIQNKTIRPPRSARFWIAVVFLAGIFAMLQGGLATEVIYQRFFPSTLQSDSYFEVGFSVVPPAVISSHLGKLSVFHPLQLLAALLEMGPLILALPLVLLWGYKAIREEKWIEAALVASAIPSLLSIFVEYAGNAGITATTRLLSNLFFVCRALAVPLVWLWLQNKTEWMRGIVYTLGAAALLGGILLFAIELIAIPRPVYGEFISDMDARFYEEYWDRLSPPDAWVLDPSSSRAPTVFGRQANSIIHWGVHQPEYLALLQNPDPYQLNAAGYSYVYADKDYWKINAVQLEQPCVHVLKTVEGAKLSHGELIPDFRRLADISGCK